jgi:hypothetical protein
VKIDGSAISGFPFPGGQMGWLPRGLSPFRFMYLSGRSRQKLDPETLEELIQVVRVKCFLFPHRDRFPLRLLCLGGRGEWKITPQVFEECTNILHVLKRRNGNAGKGGLPTQKNSRRPF